MECWRHSGGGEGGIGRVESDGGGGGGGVSNGCGERYSGIGAIDYSDGGGGSGGDNGIAGQDGRLIVVVVDIVPGVFGITFHRSYSTVRTESEWRGGQK